MEHPKVANCVLDGNPLYQEQMEIVGMLGRMFAVNTVLDDERNISFVNFGDIEAGLLEAVDYMCRYAEIPALRRIPHRCDQRRRLPPGQDLLPDR